MWSRLASFPGPLRNLSCLILPVWVVRSPLRCRLGKLYPKNDVPVTAYSIYRSPESVLGSAGT